MHNERRDFEQIGPDLPDHRQRIADRFGAEEDPGYRDQMKGHENAHERKRRTLAHRRQHIAEPMPQTARGESDPLVRTVERTPDQERPPYPVAKAGMPESADHEYQHDVEIAAQRPRPAAP